MTVTQDEPVYVNADAALQILKDAGLELSKWQLYALVRQGALAQGEIVLRASPRRVRFRANGLRSWVARGGCAETAAAG